MGEDISLNKDKGLVKYVLKKGKGRRPPPNAHVKVHYESRLYEATGSLLFSSRQKQKPHELCLGRGLGMRGLQQALSTMEEGERALVECESEWGYGKEGYPPAIPRNTKIYLDVELLSFVDCDSSSYMGDEDERCEGQVEGQHAHIFVSNTRVFYGPNRGDSSLFRSIKLPYWEETEIDKGKGLYPIVHLPGLIVTVQSEAEALALLRSLPRMKSSKVEVSKPAVDIDDLLSAFGKVSVEAKTNNSTSTNSSNNNGSGSKDSKHLPPQQNKLSYPQNQQKHADPPQKSSEKEKQKFRRVLGTIIDWKVDKSFGFIAPKIPLGSNDPQVYFNHHALQDYPIEADISRGNLVEFEPTVAAKGFAARNIYLCSLQRRTEIILKYHDSKNQKYMVNMQIVQKQSAPTTLLEIFDDNGKFSVFSRFDAGIGPNNDYVIVSCLEIQSDSIVGSTKSCQNCGLSVASTTCANCEHLKCIKEVYIFGISSSKLGREDFYESFLTILENGGVTITKKLQKSEVITTEILKKVRKTSTKNSFSPKEITDFVDSLKFPPLPTKFKESDDEFLSTYLRMELKPHQKFAVYWMKECEDGPHHGGILADDMGMGKTYTTIAHIVKNLEGDRKLREKSVRGTLVVCKASILGQWEDEFFDKIKVKKLGIRVAKFHETRGNGKLTKKEIWDLDVVITTYGIVERDKGILFPENYRWNRIILDEGHTIHNIKTQVAQKLKRVDATYRWVLTGTPIQNTIIDIHGLLSFLHIAPYDNYEFFKSISKNSDFLPVLREFLPRVLLRRTKHTVDERGIPILSLPKRELIWHVTRFSEKEQRVYEFFVKFLRSTIEGSGLLSKEGKNSEFSSNKSGQVLALRGHILRICNHLSLLNQEKLAKLFQGKDLQTLQGLLNAGGEAKGKVKKTDSNVDGEAALILCKSLHFCLNIHNLPNLVAQMQNSLDINKQNSSVITSSDSSEKVTSSSSKVDMALEQIRLIRENEPDAKILLFSQWTKMLDLLEPPLIASGLQFVRLQGSMKASQREVALKQFREDKNITVFLLSLKAGGVGLNLTAANHVMMLDMWYNPAVEEQACDRFLVEKTVEEKLVKIQNQKKQLADSLLVISKSDAPQIDKKYLQEMVHRERLMTKMASELALH